MQKQILLDDRDLETADLIGHKRFQENKKHQKTMSWNLKKMKTADRDCLGAQGEIAWEKWCLQHGIDYTPDYHNTQCRSATTDPGDGTLFLHRQAYSVEIKTTTAKDPHLIIPAYQFKHPKDIYILIKKTSETKFKLMGFTIPTEIDQYWDDSCLHTVNTCYRMHHRHLIGDWEDFTSLFTPTEES